MKRREPINKHFYVIFLFAFLLRFMGIISRPIWYDEAFAILFSEKGLSAMLYGTLTQTSAGSADIHPLGYYTILWTWMQIFGRSIISARMLSILISLFSLLLIYKISKKIFNQATALWAAGIFSILPFQIHFAQEIRMYALLTFSLLLPTYAFLKARTGNWKWWIVFSLSSALAQYTHNLAAIYLIPLALTPLFQKDWKTLRSLILAGFAALILYIPWLIHVPAQISKVHNQYWVEKPGLEKIFTLILFYLPHLPLPNLFLIVGLFISILIITLAVFQTYLAYKNKIPTRNHGLWLAYLAFMPPIFLWTISQVVPVYIERALLPSHAIFCMWLAWSITETKPPRIIQALISLMILISSALGFYQHLNYTGFPYGNFSEIDKSIHEKLETGDVIIHSSKLSYLPMLYFDSTLPQGFMIDPPNSSIDTLAPATREVLHLTEYENIEEAAIYAKRIWFVIYQSSIDEYASSIKTLPPDLEYLNENFRLENIEEWDDVRVYLYSSLPKIK